MVVAVPVQLALALGMAMMLRHVRRGRDLMLWIWSIPLGISDLAAGLVWLAILTDKGYLNTVLVPPRRHPRAAKLADLRNAGRAVLSPS